MSHSGKVQCTVTPVILKNLGFKFWDLGMGMDYKSDLGAVEVHRLEFLEMLDNARGTECTLAFETRNCREVLAEFKATQKDKEEHVPSA